MTGPAAFDHAILLSDSLADGIDGLTRLGFRPTPTGHHGALLGTQNVTVVLPDGETYFEVLAVAEPTPKNADKRAALAAIGRHLHGLAIKGDARRLHAHFASLSLAEGEPFDFAREVDLPAGPREARFTIAAMAPGALPGLYGFVCQQHTPDIVWREDYRTQPNGALALTGLEGVAPDAAALAATWARLFENAIRLDEDGTMTATLGNTRVRYRPPEAFAAPSVKTPRILTLEFAVASLDALAALLAQNGVAFERRAGSVRVGDTLGLGAAFAFHEGAFREETGSNA